MPRQTTNLNTVPYWETERYRSKKQKYKNHENFHYRGEIKIAGKEGGVLECKECKKLLSLSAFSTSGIRSDGAYFLKKLCRECHVIVQREHRDARKKAPPKPKRCNCCHLKKKLVVDHRHGTTEVRGWLCNDCNVGMGQMRDNLEGVLQAAIYLENDKDKIIETLHKVYDEMFARTNEEKF